jgi:hypothetical protein
MATGVSTTARQSAAGDSTSTIVRESLVSEQIHHDVSALLMYPFSRAQRIELSAGLDAIGFRTSALTSTFSGTGRLLDQTQDVRPGLPAVTIGQTSAALVYDTSIEGGASPILGQRYRLAVATTFGDLRLATLTGDYRKYVMPLRPFTLALRVEHVGRYGPDAADPRLLPFVWYVQDTVRGFDGRQLPPARCDAQACDGIDAATTKRLVATNVELRFPLIGALRRTRSYGAIPIEGLVFSDTGAFWTADSTPAMTRTVLRSAGAGMRLNAAGFVFECDAAHPVAMSGGWRVSVNFRPGF